MGTSKRAEKRMLTAEEFETVSRTHHPEIRELARKDLSDLLGRLRGHREAGTALKREVFAGAVKRLNREIARQESAERRSAKGEKSRHDRDLAGAGGKPSKPAPAEKAAKKPKPTRARKA